MSARGEPAPKGGGQGLPPRLPGIRATNGKRAPARRPAAPRPAPERPAGAIPRPAPARGPRRGGKAGGTLLVETVFFYLYDVGRSIDLKKVTALIPAHDDLGIVKRRDTPASLSLPRPLTVQLGESECIEHGDFECFSAQAKLYDEGAMTLLVRVRNRMTLAELGAVGDRVINAGGTSLTVGSYAEQSFRKLCDAIAPAVSEPRLPSECDRETYTAFCVLECGQDPAGFIERNRAAVAGLLIGEGPGASLHPSQVEATLGKPFAYRDDDLAVFDMDRCLIVDPRADYEDLLLIVENANYQLLELRVLDKLLDRWLDEAERDMRSLYAGKGRKRGARSTPQQKFARIQSLRFDALFILENLENSSKIIGDYYLGQVYDRLCSIFNTEGWKWSVERRLDALQDIYEMVKNDANDRKILTLEVVFIVVCIVFPIIQILQVFLLG